MANLIDDKLPERGSDAYRRLVARGPVQYRLEIVHAVAPRVWTNAEKENKRQAWKDRDARIAARKLDWARREAIEEKKFQWRLRRDGLA